ncbi:MAG: hypothetical protein JWO36_4544, partial [Myxococcales bacterium]|nr:hypothetical protein [Myxococcales bacterium]
MRHVKVRLRGVVQAEGAAQQTFRRITLVSGNETLSSVEQGELVLALAEGGVATIEMINEELQLVGATPSIVRGPWSELRARPEAAGLDYNLSAELGDVELHVLSIEPGEPIEVFGETVEHATGDAGRPSRLMAEIVTFGEREDAMRAMTLAISQRKEREHAPRDPKSSSDIIGDPGDPASSPRLLAWLPSGFALLAVILCLVGFAFSHSARIKWELLVNAPMWAAVGLSFRPGLDVPEFRRREKPLWAKGSSQFYVRMVLATGPMMFLVSMTSPPAPYSSNRPILSAPSLLVFSIVFIIGWIASEYVWNGAAHRLHATLGAAPPADADKWGVCEGTVSARRPTTIAGTRAAMGVVTQFKT